MLLKNKVYKLILSLLNHLMVLWSIMNVSVKFIFFLDTIQWLLPFFICNSICNSIQILLNWGMDVFTDEPIFSYYSDIQEFHLFAFLLLPHCTFCTKRNLQIWWYVLVWFILSNDHHNLLYSFYWNKFDFETTFFGNIFSLLRLKNWRVDM